MPSPHRRRRARVSVCVVVGCLVAQLSTWFRPQLVAVPGDDLATSRSIGGSDSTSVVLVTGAGGRTGKLVLEQLLCTDGMTARALVHTAKSKRKLLAGVAGLRPEQVFVADVRKHDELDAAFRGVGAVVIVTSSVPTIKMGSIIRMLLAKLVGKKGGRPEFTWKGGRAGRPEIVDWEGQRNQIDAAMAAGCAHVVLVGSMGGTQVDNFLNTIGEGEGDKILQWKRKAEQYLIAQCKTGKMSHTIIHPGGLLSLPAGDRELVVGVDDHLQERPTRSIPRGDVASVCVAALGCKAAKNRAFDLCSNPSGEGKPFQPEDLEKMLQTLRGASCNYELNPAP